MLFLLLVSSTCQLVIGRLLLILGRLLVSFSSFLLLDLTNKGLDILSVLSCFYSFIINNRIKFHLEREGVLWFFTLALFDIL